MSAADEDALVGQIVQALRLIVQAAVSAVPDGKQGWALFERAVEEVRETAATEGLVTVRATQCRVENLKPDANGIVSVKHNLGAERVKVQLYNADGVMRKHRRLGIPIDDTEVEVIASHADVTYADVEIIADP